MITIAVQCHNFQRRFCWMLSSLAQQTKAGLAAVTVDVAHMPGNGTPTVEEMQREFSTVKIRRTEWTNYEEFQLRGLIRNRQLKECETEWLMFSDSDMVYHPEYFERLMQELNTNHAKANYMLSSGRSSNPKEEGNALVDGMVAALPYIPAAFETAGKLTRIPKQNVGAGFCQIINMKHCPHGGYYVDPTKNKDWSWNRKFGFNPRSDMQFRWRLNDAGSGRRALPHWFSHNAIHLNHDRDPDAGKHLDTQR